MNLFLYILLLVVFPMLVGAAITWTMQRETGRRRANEWESGVLQVVESIGKPVRLGGANYLLVQDRPGHGWLYSSRENVTSSVWGQVSDVRTDTISGHVAGRVEYRDWT